MPTYDYECDACKHKWELIQSIKAKPVKACPKCLEDKARRLISLGTFILKGKGWAEDGYTK
jgi:putative FmdB family regulatory protein